MLIVFGPLFPEPITLEGGGTGSCNWLRSIKTRPQSPRGLKFNPAWLLHSEQVARHGPRNLLCVALRIVPSGKREKDHHVLGQTVYWALSKESLLFILILTTVLRWTLLSLRELHLRV